MRRNLLVPVSLVLVLLAPMMIVRAQEPEPSYPASDQQAQTATQKVWSADELDNLVAPIALFPDPLLGQMLVASTYPLEVVEASQWLQRNKSLHGQALVDAAKQQPWDPSIQALVTVPDALAKLNQDITWTTDLGNAFLAQQADVMSAVQRMRARAEENGRLSSTPQQSVTTQNDGGQQAIVIQPANPQVIYVPVYDPWYVWGPPVYGFYPPLYYPPFGFGFGFGFDVGFCFNDWGGWGLWGWGPNWFGRTVFVNNFFFHHYGFHDGFRGGFRGRTPWVHNPVHRLQVPYGTPQLAARFGGRWATSQNSFRTGAAGRGTAWSYANRSRGSFAGSAGGQGYRGAEPQAQRYQNPPRQTYQPSQRYQPPTQQYRSAPQVQPFQSQQRQSYEAPRQNRSSPAVVPFGGRSQQVYQAPRQYRPAPQVYQSPQIQRFQSQPQLRYQSPQYRAAPRMSAPQLSVGGNSGRSGGGSFGRGGGSFSRGGGGSFNRGGGGGRRR